MNKLLQMIDYTIKSHSDSKQDGVYRIKAQTPAENDAIVHFCKPQMSAGLGHPCTAE